MKKLTIQFLPKNHFFVELVKSQAEVIGITADLVQWTQDEVSIKGSVFETLRHQRTQQLLQSGNEEQSFVYKDG